MTCSSVAASEPGDEQDRNELTTKFDMVRPEVLAILRQYHLDDEKFGLTFITTC